MHVADRSRDHSTSEKEPSRCRFDALHDIEHTCLQCTRHDYTLGTIIFNVFVWCQLFNEYNARMIGNELNMFAGIQDSSMFLLVSIFSMLLQVLIIEKGGEFTKTSGLDIYQWLIWLHRTRRVVVGGWLADALAPCEGRPGIIFLSW